MTPMKHIRKHVFGMSQAALAQLTGTTQATVSRWEKGELSPGLNDLAAIRAEAARRNVNWDDSLFFQVPAPVVQPDALAS